MQIIHLADSFLLHKIDVTELTIFRLKESARKPHPSQTAVDSLFNYLYYSSQTTKSEMFASAIKCLSE
jgi:hypothetical protein